MSIHVDSFESLSSAVVAEAVRIFLKEKEYYFFRENLLLGLGMGTGA